MKQIANFFLGLGVLIGLVGVGALGAGFRPSTLPPGLLDISVYKLVFIAAACVLGAGAVVRRAERRRTLDAERRAPAPALGEGAAEVAVRDGGRAAEEAILRRP